LSKKRSWHEKNPESKEKSQKPADVGKQLGNGRRKRGMRGEASYPLKRKGASKKDWRGCPLRGGGVKRRKGYQKQQLGG